VADGREGCRSAFDALVGRDFSDARYFATHRLFVDTYSLQHPDEFCRSAKSLCAHLTGLCWVLEGGAGTAIGPKQLHRWLDGNRVLEKPPVPAERGAITLGDLPIEAEPAIWAAALRAWAESTWAAWGPLHDLARDWLRQASKG
jgi:hypothetical protein